MKINKKDMKHNVLVITPENLTDLYIVSQLIEENDQVFGNTTRRVRSPGHESRDGDKGQRIKIYLGIQVIEVDYQDSDVEQRLRIKGKIICATLAIAEGAIHEGQLEMTSAKQKEEFVERRAPDYQEIVVDGGKRPPNEEDNAA